jgi:ABC-type multidrug transport system ATPase subunit
VLAKRKTFGNIEGNILYNGKRIKSSHLPTNIAGYVRQDDYHLAPLTVRESMQFAADLRCRSSEKEKREKVSLISFSSLSNLQKKNPD